MPSLWDFRNAGVRWRCAGRIIVSGAQHPAALPFLLKWRNAAKDILDDLDSIGFDCGSGVAILVGHGGEHSIGRIELVGGLSQRLVLACEIPALCRTGTLACPLCSLNPDGLVVGSLSRYLPTQTGQARAPVLRVLRLWPPSR